MGYAYFALGPHGKAVLEDESAEPVILERRPPANVGHLTGVNDCRVSSELAGCAYFFAHWELPQINWRHKLIPDAIFSLQDQPFAIEFDRGFEGAAFFARTKLSHYEKGFPNLPCCRLLVVTESEVRMKALARAIGNTSATIFFTTIELIRTHGLLAPIFYREPFTECEAEVLLSPSLDEKRVFAVQRFGYQQLEVSQAGPIKAGKNSE